MTTWGICSTILAPTPDILRFAAYHLEQGAHRLYIYLDDDNHEAYARLKSHPKIRVQMRDKAWWEGRKAKRPMRHQLRQIQNATYAYHRKTEVDWLAHIDVDEFLVSFRPVADVLGDLPDTAKTARIRPMELLADGDGTAYKGFAHAGSERRALVAELYPTFGAYLRGGFLSHVSGKLFVRTGLPDISIRIHKAFEGETEIPGAVELVQVDLAHRHSQSWEKWIKSFRYRLEHGTYRAVLDPGREGIPGTMSLHEMFRVIEETEGEAGLRAFHEEVAADSPAMRAKLDAHGLLRIVDLDLDTTVAKHFPGAV